MTTELVLKGTTKTQLIRQIRAAVAAKRLSAPESGAMSYMMSKQGYINDDAHHWYSHVMFFMPRTEGASWGANSPGVPMFSDSDDLPPATTFLAGGTALTS